MFISILCQGNAEEMDNHSFLDERSRIPVKEARIRPSVSELSNSLLRCLWKRVQYKLYKSSNTVSKINRKKKTKQITKIPSEFNFEKIAIVMK